ncbi:hypothetical protein Taro_045811, partial [Colocasia esculenta]|nr:hypothetical protein [Colocasia esculenta]
TAPLLSLSLSLSLSSAIVVSPPPPLVDALQQGSPSPSFLLELLRRTPARRRCGPQGRALRHGGRESVTALGYDGVAAASTTASGSWSGEKEDNSASGSLSPTPSPSGSPPPVDPGVATSAKPAAASGGAGMGLIMGSGLAPHHPMGFGAGGRVVGMGMAATSMT